MCGCKVGVGFGECVRGAQELCKTVVVGAKLGKHISGSDKFLVIVFQALMLGNVSNGTDCDSANLACPLRDVVRHGEDLLRVLGEQSVGIAEVSAAHGPVEIYRLPAE